MIDNLRLWFNPNLEKSKEFLVRKYKNYIPQLGKDPNFNNNVSSTLNIDILIPLIEKDLTLLPFVVEYARKYIGHPIGKIFIISPSNKNIYNLTKELKCYWIDEQDVMGFSKQTLNYRPNGIERNGWLYQQLIKLSADNIAENEHFLILDADTLFIRPRVFEYKGKYILDHSDEWHLPYFDIYKKLTGWQPSSPLSFVCHYMLVEKSKLRLLRSHIEDYCKTDWVGAILKNLDLSQNSGFSEYELYGNFVMRQYNKEYMEGYWFNKALGNSEIEKLSCLVGLHSMSFKSLSFHNYV